MLYICQFVFAFEVPGRAPQVTAGGFLYHRITKMLDLYWQVRIQNTLHKDTNIISFVFNTHTAA